MHTGKTYKLSQFLFWTRRSLFRLLLWSSIPTILYQVFGLDWLVVPWTVVALLGTATAFIVGFRNLQTYNRTWEAREVFGTAVGASRSWAMMCRDFIGDRSRSREMIYRHLAWLTALRYQLRSHRTWESMGRSYNKEYQQQLYTIPERETPLEQELAKYLTKEEATSIMAQNNKATQLLSLQGIALEQLYTEGAIDNARFLEMHGRLREFLGHQGKSEKIKNFPYPRQYATVNRLFVQLFCVLLPFALLGEFDQLNTQVSGILKGNMVWFVIPFSMLISWIYTSLEQVGESTENPFEGNANDVPISQMSRAAEIDIRAMLGETELPAALQPQNDVVL